LREVRDDEKRNEMVAKEEAKKHRARAIAAYDRAPGWRSGLNLALGKRPEAERLALLFWLEGLTRNETRPLIASLDSLRAEIARSSRDRLAEGTKDGG
jgi:hypothetical protein